jgi:multidrug efflux pump subunit AcrA (membrane-fusion protein)
MIVETDETAQKERSLEQRAAHRSDSQPDRRRTSRVWLRPFLLAIGSIFVLGIAAIFFSGRLLTPESDPRMTHTITRGDLIVSVIEQGTLESSNNVEIKCKVRGFSTVIWVIEGGTEVKKGDELVKLDTKVIEEAVSLTKTNVHIARATLERTKADVATSEIAIDAYIEGRYRSQLKSLEKELELAKSNLLTAQKNLEQSKLFYSRGNVNDLELEGSEFAVTQAELVLKVKTTQIDVLERFTKEMELETLKGNLTANKSKLQADEAGLEMDETRRDRAVEELANCVIKADRDGMVIYPSAAAWKNTPDIAEGAAVRHDQVLLLMPDLSKMQVKVGIHESVIDRVQAGQTALVTLPDRTLEAKVSSVATVTKPSGWWTGNVVKYDTIIELPPEQGLKPGMSAEVEVILARHQNVLKIPVAAVIETDEGDFCWVKTSADFQRRALQLGDSNDVFIVVEGGLKAGDQVVLNPMAYIEEAQQDVLKSIDQAKQQASKATAMDSDAGEQKKQTKESAQQTSAARPALESPP